VDTTTPVDATTCLAGRYRLLECLGEGGTSVVWRAHDDVLNRVVAVKLLAADQMVDAAARARIQAEAQAAAALCHPNVAGVYDYGESPGPSGGPVPYVVMELVDGCPLTDVLADGPVAPSDAMRICADVAAGLAAAHARGLVHRDVKPGNVIVTAGGAKLVDFGIAATIGDLDEADADGIMLGTPAYLAPERLDDGVVVPGSDVYALGLLLYRLLAGVPPWSVETTIQMLEAHAYLPPQPLPCTEGVPVEVADLCHRCLAKNPIDRPTAADAAALLTDAARPAPPSLRQPVAAPAGVPARPSAIDTGGGAPDDPGEAHTDTGGSAGAEPDGTTADRRARRRARKIAIVAALIATLVVLSPTLVGSPSTQPGAGGQGPGAPALPAPDASSFPDGSGGSGAAATASRAAATTDLAGSQPGQVGQAGAGTASGPAPGGGTVPPGDPEPAPAPNPVQRSSPGRGRRCT
jgi:serine/threonine-protein kinase